MAWHGNKETDRRGHQTDCLLRMMRFVLIFSANRVEARFATQFSLSIGEEFQTTFSFLKKRDDFSTVDAPMIFLTKR